MIEWQGLWGPVMKVRTMVLKWNDRKDSGSTHRWLAFMLASAMVLTGNMKLFAQDVPPPPPDAQDQQQPQSSTDSNQQIPQYGAPLPSDSEQQQPQEQDQQTATQDPQQATAQPLSPDQLDQLVAPIALYPDALVAQILAASTYPTQVVEAYQWIQSQGNASPDQIASAANAQPWDPSVKALTAFPSVLKQMNDNLQWTTDLGNAYYNQPQDVMDAVQQMRQRAQQAGTLTDTPQETVAEDDGNIEIEPANPDVVYVPVYDPWVVYGTPLVAWPGYYYAPAPAYIVGVGFGWGFRMGFAWGVPLRPWAPWGWGWNRWGCGWYNRTVIYNRTTYITRSTTVINRGVNRPGSPPLQLAGIRGSFINRPQFANYARNVAMGARPAPAAMGTGRPGMLTQPANRVNPGGVMRPAAPANGFMNQNRPATQNMPRPAYPSPDMYRPLAPQAPAYNRPMPVYRAPQGNAPTYRAPEYHAAPPHVSAPPAPHFSAPPAPHFSGGGEPHHR